MSIRSLGGSTTLAGLTFAGLGGISLVLARDLTAGTALQMGPGYIPRILGWLLLGLGLLIAVKGLLSGREDAPRFHLRPLILVTASIVAFGLLLRPLGLVLASALAVVIASAADRDFTWRGAVPLGLALGAAASLIFVAGLGVPVPLWPL